MTDRGTREEPVSWTSKGTGRDGGGGVTETKV